jgi:23S rRNA (adenine2503-C2)-methyltransferase
VDKEISDIKQGKFKELLNTKVHRRYHGYYYRLITTYFLKRMFFKMESSILRSTEDRSINIVNPTDDGGAIEARFVQRTEDTIVVYLSSMSGCNLSCRFCHLTQTGQTMMTPVTVDGYRKQAGAIFDILQAEKKLEGVKIVHFNFMARGDALSNPHFIENTADVITALRDKADWYGLAPKFKISTIFPKSDYSDAFLQKWVATTLTLHPDIEFYYSLYALNNEFRKRWIPKAMDPEVVGAMFRGTVKRLRLHHALIEGENTSVKNLVAIGQWMERHDIHGHFNIVRYNPFSKACGSEASDETIEFWRRGMEKLDRVVSSRVITKVGEDIAASCGMFITE